VEASVPDLPREVRAGDTLPLSLNVMNLGKNTIYNVRYTVEGPGLLSSGPAFIGNMEAGTAKAGDMNIFIGTRDMSEGYEGTERYGRTEGILTLVYEDETGEEAAQTFEITTTIREPLFGEEEESPEDKPETAGQWWISILIGGLTIAGLAGILILRRRQERRGQEKKGYEIF
jgi:LPXTG-motif cell wall-anchored protein